MKWLLIFGLLWGGMAWGGPVAADELPFPKELARLAPISMAELAKRKTDGVAAVEVSDYVFGNYKGKLPSPPCADLNPKKAFVIFWKDFPYRFVLRHEGSYCPWFELPDGAGACFQFFEGNDGWAELFNQWGRQERNSFVDVDRARPQTGVGPLDLFRREREGRPARLPGHRRLLGLSERARSCGGRPIGRCCPAGSEGYAREPIELIGMCPVGKRWLDVLEKDPASEERHALAVLDPFSARRYDVYWTPKPGTVWDSTHRRAGCAWKELDDAAGVVLVLPLKEGAAFCVFGDASGYRHDYTRIKEHTYKDTGGEGWGSSVGTTGRSAG